MAISVETKKTITDVLKAVVVLISISSAILFFVLNDPIPYILGLVFGASVSFLLFVELAITITKSVKMTPGKANAYTAFKYHLRLIIFGVVIFVSIKVPQVEAIGTIAGILSVKLVIYFINIFLSKKSQRKEE